MAASRRKGFCFGAAVACAAALAVGIAACAVGYDGTSDHASGQGGSDAAIRHLDGASGSDSSSSSDAAATCTDGMKNGTEVDVDCGGDCPPCPTDAFSPTTSGTIAGGTHEFSTFTIPAGVTITITGNDPLDVSVTGAVVIDGVLSGDGSASQLYLPDGGVSGGIGAGVAGGSAGGECGVRTATAGAGPGGGGGGTASASSGWGTGGGGGGFANAGSPGTRAPADGTAYPDSVAGTAGAMYGDATLTAPDGGAALLGGSGGGGGGSYGYCNNVGTTANTSSSAGGGGGGAIRISSKTSITIGAAGSVTVNGGASAPTVYPAGTGGGGSGGSLWLRAPTLTIDGSVKALGGTAGTPGTMTSPPPGQTGGTLQPGGHGGDGSPGRIRLDATTRSGAGTIAPAAGYTGSYP